MTSLGRASTSRYMDHYTNGFDGGELFNLMKKKKQQSFFAYTVR